MDQKISWPIKSRVKKRFIFIFTIYFNFKIDPDLDSKTNQWFSVAFWLSATPIGVPSPTFRAGPNRRQIPILVLCFLLQEGQQDRRRNHFR